MLPDADGNRLSHMVEAISEAIKYAEGRSRSDLDTDPPLKHLLVRNLEILGEAASRVSPEFRQAHVEIPWQRIVGMRNRLIHAYVDLDLDIIWSTVQRALPDLLERLQKILSEEAGG